MDEFTTIVEEDGEDDQELLVSITLWEIRRDCFEVEWDDQPMVSLGGGSHNTAEEALAEALRVAERRTI
jgi:hypothetical protein